MIRKISKIFFISLVIFTTLYSVSFYLFHGTCYDFFVSVYNVAVHILVVANLSMYFCFIFNSELWYNAMRIHKKHKGPVYVLTFGEPELMADESVCEEFLFYALGNAANISILMFFAP